LREAFPYRVPHRHLIFDRDSKFGLETLAAVKAIGSSPVRTSFKSPWQNGVAVNAPGCRIRSTARLGGLHHRYNLAA